MPPLISNFDYLQSFRDAIKPTRKVTCDVWADENVVLTSDTSAEPGPWRTQRFPFMREPLQQLSPMSPATHIYMPKGVQISATACAIVTMLTYADTDPCGIMYVMPTISIAEGFSKDKLAPMISTAVTLEGKFKDPRARDAQNTVMHKKFRGGFIALAGANSAASLRSRSVRVLIMDEADAYPRNLENEGSPIGLAEKRTVSYGNRKKVFVPSTPTEENGSLIWALFEKTDQRFYHVHCPHCDGDQHLVFEQLVWEPNNPDSALYRCVHCGHLISEDKYKTRMLNGGEWISSIPAMRNPYRIGYHINSLYSPYGWYSWRDAARDYEDAQTEILVSQEDNKMRTFVNTVLGKPYSTPGESAQWKSIMEANKLSEHKRMTINNSVRIITMGVDVQKDRVEYEIVGWGEDLRSWSINYGVVAGHISEEATKKELLEVANQIFKRPDGIEIPIARVCIDSNYDTTEVYNFCRKLDRDIWTPIHGSRHEQFSVLSSPKFATKTDGEGQEWSVLYYMLGVDMLKDELYRFLRKVKDPEMPPPPGYCTFPADYPQNYYEGLCAEKKVTTQDKHGYPVKKYVKHFARNEPLDVRNYARAALSLCGWEEFGNKAIEAAFHIYQQRYQRTDNPKKAAIKQKIQAKSYWNRDK